MTSFGVNAPIVLLLWLIIGAVVFLYVFKKTEAKQNFLYADIIESVYEKNTLSFKIFIVSIILTYVTIGLMFSGPYRSYEVETVKKNGVDMQIVFDLSYSMMATDILPNRLESAKKVLVNFLSELEQDRVGLILFSGKPFQSVPLSYDYDFFKDYVEKIEIDTISQQRQNLQGTAIGDALILASDGLDINDENMREKIIILITDGEANQGVDPGVAQKLLIEKNIKTYTIGVGREGDTYIDIPFAGGYSQRMQIAGVDEETLKDIANSTDGKYFRAEDRKGFEDIMSEILGLERRPLETEVLTQKSSLGEILYIFIALNLLLQLYLLIKKGFRAL